jgi:hypothetical protein
MRLRPSGWPRTEIFVGLLLSEQAERRRRLAPGWKITGKQRVEGYNRQDKPARTSQLRNSLLTATPINFGRGARARFARRWLVLTIGAPLLCFYFNLLNTNTKTHLSHSKTKQPSSLLTKKLFASAKYKSAPVDLAVEPQAHSGIDYYKGITVVRISNTID